MMWGGIILFGVFVAQFAYPVPENPDEALGRMGVLVTGSAIGLLLVGAHFIKHNLLPNRKTQR